MVHTGIIVKAKEGEVPEDLYPGATYIVRNISTGNGYAVRESDIAKMGCVAGDLIEYMDDPSNGFIFCGITCSIYLN